MIVFNAHSCWEVRLQVDRKNILDTCPIGKMSYFDSDVYVCMHTGTIATQQLLARDTTTIGGASHATDPHHTGRKS